MNRVLFLSWVGLVTGMTFASQTSHAFSSLTRIQLMATATVGGGRSAPLNALTITAVPLSNQVFFGKNLVIGVDVANTTTDAPIDTATVKVDLVYQLADAQGQPLNAMITAPAVLQVDPLNPRHVTGSVVVPRSDLLPIQAGGSLEYYFQAMPSASSPETILSKSGSRTLPADAGTVSASDADFFTSSIITELSQTVTPGGSNVSLPDTFQSDGETAFNFPSGAVSAPTSLRVAQTPLTGLPPGPNGLQPVVAYTASLDDGASLQRPVQVILSYPADLNGRLIGTSIDPSSLAPYRLDANQWQLLSLPQINTTLHTVTAMSSSFSTFALFAVGPVGSADLRPSQRIITPNGDGKNDFADFSSVSDDVHIFSLRGRRVRTLTGFNKKWDGTDDGGHIVESGVYLYQFTANGDRVSGVIMVAK